MDDKLKSFIISDITKTVYLMKSKSNKKLNSTTIYNSWSKTINIKVTDMNFIVYLLNYIDDILLINNCLLKEIVEIENNKNI